MNLQTDSFEIYVICILVSSFVSMLTTLLVKKREKNDEDSRTIRATYQDRVSDIIECVTPLISLEPYTPHKIEFDFNKKMAEITHLYIKHYNILPDEVLLAMNCLFLCLKCEASRLYYFSTDKSIRFLTYCKTNQELLDIIEDTSIADYMYKKKYRKGYENNVNDKLVWFSKNRPDFIISTQTRYLLSIINKHYGTNNLSSWKDSLTKQTTAERNKKYWKFRLHFFENPAK